MAVDKYDEADEPEEITKGVTFQNKNSPKTKVTITNDKTPIKIIPKCTDRITVNGVPSPSYDVNGVSRDRSIIVEFTKELDPESFIFSADEIPERAETKTSGEKIWAYTFDDQTFLKNISITNADGYSIAQHFKQPSVSGKYLTVEVDKTKPITFETGVTLKTVVVTLNQAITDEKGISMSAPKSWRYQITEATDDKATISFASGSGEGTINAISKSYSIGQTIALSFSENADFQFIKWNYDKDIIYIEDDRSLDTKVVVLDKTTESNPTKITAVCAPRLRITDFSPSAESSSAAVSKNSSIVITFNQNIPNDEQSLGQLGNIMVTVGGAPVNSSFNAPTVTANTITFTADESNMLEVAAGQIKTVTVSVPADFYYLLDDGTKVTYGGNGKSYNYKIDETTLQQAEITFTASANSGSLTAASGTKKYSLGQEVELSFVPGSDFQFNGWSINRGTNEVLDTEIKILDKKALTTKLIVYKELKGVTITANASQKLTVTGSPSSGVNPKDSKIELTFNKAIPAACEQFFDDISIRMNGSNVEAYFTPVHTTDAPNKIILNNTKYLDVNTNETKLITVTVPSSFYYMDGNVKVNLEKEYSFDYEVNSTTNSKTNILYSVAADGSGTINQISSAYDIGTVVDLKFNINNGYQFTGWDINAGGTTVGADAIRIEDASAVSTKMYIYKQVSNVTVTANAYLIPAIVSVYPPFASNGYDQDSTIQITFNKQMNISSFDDFDCISITNASGEVLFPVAPANVYYERPFFSDNNTVLNIPTVKGNYIISPDSQSINYVDLIFYMNITDLEDTQGYLLQGLDTYTHTFRVNKNIDDIPPVITDIHLFSTSDETDYFHKELTDKPFFNEDGEINWSAKTVKYSDGSVQYYYGDYNNNHVSHVFMKISAYDNYSGIKSIRVKETYKRDKSDNDVTEQSCSNDFDVSTMGTETDSAGNKTYKFDFQFDSDIPENGLFLLEISVVDNAGKESIVKNYWVIKDTKNYNVFSAVIAEMNSFRFKPYTILPQYNPITKQYEAYLSVREFVINKQNFYNYHKNNNATQECYSDRVLTLEMYEEGAEPTVIIDKQSIGRNDKYLEASANATVDVKGELEKFCFNPEKNLYIKITMFHESGVVGELTLLVPKAVYISKRTSTGGLYVCDGDRDYDGLTAVNRFYYTYKGPEDSEYGALTELPNGNFTSSMPDGNYMIYVSKELYPNQAYPYQVFSPMCRGYLYIKGSTQSYDNSFPLPSFILPSTTNSITYEQNTGKAKFYIDVESPAQGYTEKDGYTYSLFVETKGYPLGSYTITNNNTVYYRIFIECGNSGSKTVSLNVKDSTGKVIKESEATSITLGTVDNYPPELKNYESVWSTSLIDKYIDTDIIHIKRRPEDKPDNSNLTILKYWLVPQAFGDKLDYEYVKANFVEKTVTLSAEDITNKEFKIPADGFENNFYIYYYLQDNSTNENYSFDCFYERNWISKFFPTLLNSTAGNLTVKAPIYTNSIGQPGFNDEWWKYSFPDDSWVYMLKTDYITIHTLDTENTEWITSSVKNTEMTRHGEETAADTYYTYDITYNNFSNNFVKINVVFSKRLDQVYAINMLPVYVYTGYYKYLADYESEHSGQTAPGYCKIKNWSQMANGLQIFTDKPCFVHTRFCSKNLTEPGDLSKTAAYEWETLAQETGLVYNDGSASTFTYTAENLTDVPTGYYYTTICHFADGTVLMSEVKQK